MTTQTTDPIQELCERQIRIVLHHNPPQTAHSLRLLLCGLENVRVEHVNAALVDMISELRVSVDEGGKFYI